MKFIEDDGGREEAGYTGTTGDCVTRAISIATGTPYKEVYDSLFGMMKDDRKYEKGDSPRKGVRRKVYEAYLKTLGWKWTPTMQIGSGCTVHVKEDELPEGRLILRLSRHLTAVVDGELHDTYDCSRDGTRCVYGYFSKK